MLVTLAKDTKHMTDYLCRVVAEKVVYLLDILLVLFILAPTPCCPHWFHNVVSAVEICHVPGEL